MVTLYLSSKVPTIDSSHDYDSSPHYFQEPPAEKYYGRLMKGLFGFSEDFDNGGGGGAQQQRWEAGIPFKRPNDLLAAPLTVLSG